MAKEGDLRRARFAGHSYDPETGRIMVRVEWPDQPPKKPWQPTPRQGVILAIVDRHFQQGGRGVSIAALHRLVAGEWKSECERQKLLDPKFKLVPGRDTVARTLRRLSSLIS
jgi:hypothetical protein